MTQSADWRTHHSGSILPALGRPQRLLVRGQGARVWDETGKEYLDLLAGIAVNALGHAHPALVEAVSDQVATLGQVSNYFASQPQIALAEKLLEVALRRNAGAIRLPRGGVEERGVDVLGIQAAQARVTEGVGGELQRAGCPVGAETLHVHAVGDDHVACA